MNCHGAHSCLRRVLSSLAADGYDVASLSADDPNKVIAWADRVLRAAEPKQHKGHGLSRLDARATVEQVQHLRGCAHRFVDAINRAVKTHDQAILAHNRRARAMIRDRQARRR